MELFLKEYIKEESGSYKRAARGVVISRFQLVIPIFIILNPRKN